MSKKYIHYGSSHFDKEKFIPIVNETVFVKPHGGMWASPCNSKFGWKEWCESENWRIERLLEHFVFELKENSDVLIIDSNANLDALKSMGYCIEYLNYASSDQYYLDFEKLLDKGWDAIEVHINSEIYWSLYGWDCDSLLVLNPDCIVEITK